MVNFLFFAQFDLMKVTRSFGIFVLNHIDGEKINHNKHVTTTKGGLCWSKSTDKSVKSRSTENSTIIDINYLIIVT